MQLGRGAMKDFSKNPASRTEFINKNIKGKN